MMIGWTEYSHLGLYRSKICYRDYMEALYGSEVIRPLHGHTSITITEHLCSLIAQVHEQQEDVLTAGSGVAGAQQTPSVSHPVS